MGDLGNGESQNQASKPIQISLGFKNFRWNNLLPRFLTQVPQLRRVILGFCWDLSGSGDGFLHYIFDESRALRQT